MDIEGGSTATHNGPPHLGAAAVVAAVPDSDPDAEDGAAVVAAAGVDGDRHRAGKQEPANGPALAPVPEPGDIGVEMHRP